MTRNINSDYFEWLCSLISDSKPRHGASYKKLLVHLYHTEFKYILPMDGNRYADGIDMRYRFGHENGIELPVIASCLDNNPCSVLEMMVALAFRCEEQIMFDPAYGIRSGRWFWMMVSNLGLGDMYDSRYDPSMVDTIIYNFINRSYEPDGAGNLIYIPNCQYDLRSMEIWYQMMRYLNEYRKNRME